MFTCSVEGIVGVEDCGEEAKGESADAKGHVKPGVPETLEHLRITKQTKRFKRDEDAQGGHSGRMSEKKQMIGSPRLDSRAPSSVPEAGGEFSTWTRATTRVNHRGSVEDKRVQTLVGGVPGVLLAGAPSAVQWDDFLSADARFTDGTLLPAGPRLQPLRGGGNGSVAAEQCAAPHANTARSREKAEVNTGIKHMSTFKLH